MSKKEELLKQFLDCSTRFNGHLNNLKSIPSQNFSSLDQKRMATLQNGIDALKILAQKLNNYSEGESTDVAAEKVAVEKAIETAEELEGDQTGKSQVGEPGEVDEMVRKLFEAEDLTGQNDFKPVAGVIEDARNSNAWTPEVNSIEDMNEAFSNYVANDYFRRATGREDFALHIGNKTISTNPKDYFKALGRFGKKVNNKIDDISDNLSEKYPSVSGGLKAASQGAVVGALLDITISALKRNLSYDEYVKVCKIEGLEPIEKSKYTLGTLEDLKKSLIRGGSIGAISNLALQGGKGAMEGLRTNLANANFALTPEDFADASQMAEEKSLEIMKQSFSLTRGYYPGNNNATFLEWLQFNADEYFSLRLDIYNQIINEAANFSTVGDAVKGGVIGGAIGGLTGTAIAAIKKNKSYDTYKAEAEMKGEKPLSRVAYLAKSKEVLKGGLVGLGGGATVGAVIGGSGLGRKGVETVKNLISRRKSAPIDIPAPTKTEGTGNLLSDKMIIDQDIQALKNQIAGMKSMDPNRKAIQKEIDALKVKSGKIDKMILKEYGQDYLDEITELENEKAQRLQGLQPDTPAYKAVHKDIYKRMKDLAKNGTAYGKSIEAFVAKRNFRDKPFNMTDIDMFVNNQTPEGKAYRTKIQEKVKEIQELKKAIGSMSPNKNKIKMNSGLPYTVSDQEAAWKRYDELNNSLINMLKNTPSYAKKLFEKFFSVYGYYPQHSNDMLFQNFLCQMVREGELEFRDIAAINFNFPQYQEDFAINKATIATTIGSGIAGGIGGKLLANRKIKEEEKRLGRPLTQEERSKIVKKYVIGGAVATGATGAALSYGIQHAAGKGNAVAQNIVNKVSGARDKVQSVYGQGVKKVGELKKKGNRVYKKYIHGIDYDTQDAMQNTEQYNQALTQQALGKDPSELTSAEMIALNKYYDQRKEGGLARKAMILGGAGMAYKFLGPMVQQAISRGAQVDESQVQAMVQKMQAEGKSEEEIRESVQGYLQAAFFSYAQGFHKYY